MAVSGLGDGALPALLTRAVLAWDEADKGHQASRRGEALEVVQLDGEAYGADGVEAAEAAQRGDGLGVSLLAQWMITVYYLPLFELIKKLG